MSVIETKNAPLAIGPYAQARKHNDLLFVSGQLPIDPETGDLVSTGIEDQVRQCLYNIAAIADAAGTDMNACLKTTVLVTDLGQFAAVNDIYAGAFKPPHPARATYEVSALPKGAQVEIEAVFSV